MIKCVYLENSNCVLLSCNEDKWDELMDLMLSEPSLLQWVGECVLSLHLCSDQSQDGPIIMCNTSEETY